MAQRLLCACLVSVFLLSGCAWFQRQEDKPAQELAVDGMEALRKGDFRTALEQFQKLKDWYPFSKYAILAELKIGDAHYRLKAYEEAIAAYENFENLHPRNEAVPYVIYQIGRSYFDRIDTVDRDQATARKALSTFQRLRRQYPDTGYARRAAEHVQACLQSLAGHELYVGLYYLKGKHYKAALNRFESVVRDYPDVGVHYRALQYIAMCEEQMAAEAEKERK
jgi:outer membrane protein assembly factor BamD